MGLNHEHVTGMLDALEADREAGRISESEYSTRLRSIEHGVSVLGYDPKHPPGTRAVTVILRPEHGAILDALRAEFRDHIAYMNREFSDSDLINHALEMRYATVAGVDAFDELMARFGL